MSIDPERIQAIFAAVVECAAPKEREAALDRECGDDVGLRRRVEALLRAHDDPMPLPGRGVRLTDTILEASGDSVGSVIGGRYKLLEEIAQGGMGTVWVAQQTVPVQRRVAIKLIKPGMDSRQVLSRFEAERQALALMDHPNIAKVLDGGVTDLGRPYFVMEYVKGVAITEYCDQSRLTVEERLKLFMQVCQAVQHAHRKGIVHRDLKPSNILVCLYDGVPVPKVIDFGLAKAMHQALTDQTIYTAHGQILGTPLYMSPEQAELNNVDIDTRSDVYSLGVILYELLTGTTPLEEQRFRETALQEILRLIKEEEPPRPSTKLSHSEMLPSVAAHRSLEPAQLNRVVRGELDLIVMKALEKERSRRYESASDLSRDIERFLRHEPVEAGPPSALYRFRKFAKRNRPALLVGSGIAAILVAATVVSSWQAIRATRAERLADLRALDEAAARARAEHNEALAERERVEATAQRERATRHLFISQMNLAQSAWDERIVGRARELLENQIPEAGAPIDRRGWEWEYLWRLSHSEAAILKKHANCLTFTPDGNFLIFGDEKGWLSAWDSAGHRQIWSIDANHGPIDQIAVHPNGGHLITRSRNSTIRFWEAASGREQQTFLPRDRLYSGVCLSRDGRKIAVVAPAGDVEIWSMVDGTKQTAIARQRAECTDLALVGGGSRLVATSSISGHELAVWDVSTGASLLNLDGDPRQLKDLTRRVTALAVSPDEKMLLQGGREGRLVAWSLESGAQISEWGGHKNRIKSLAFSADGARAASASLDATVKVWDTRTGQELQTLRGHESSAACVAFHPRRDLIVSSGADGTIRFWDFASRQEPAHRDLAFKPVSVSYSADGRLLAAGGYGAIAVYDASTGTELWSEPEPLIFNYWRQAAPGSICFDPESRVLVTGLKNGAVRYRDATSGRVLRTIPAHRQAVTSLAFSPDGRLFATGSFDRQVVLWNVEDGSLRASLTGHTDAVAHVAFSPTGGVVASAGGRVDSQIRLWDPADGSLLRVLKSPAEGCLYVTFSRDGRSLFCGDRDAVIRRWDVDSGELLQSHRGHVRAVDCLALSPDGRRLFSGSSDSTVRVWDVETAQELATLRTAGQEAIACLALSPDGTRLAAGLMSDSLKIWDSRPLTPLLREELLAAVKRQSASDRVDALYCKHLERGVVSQMLRDDPTLSEDVRETMIALADRRSPRPEQLDRQSWAVVSLPDRRRDEYDFALRCARLAVESVPNNPDFLLTLGVAQYRTDQFAPALENLSRAIDLCSQQGLSARQASAFAAMARFRLGDVSAARRTLSRLRQDIQRLEPNVLGELRAFIDEATRLIGTMLDERDESKIECGLRIQRTPLHDSPLL